MMPKTEIDTAEYARLVRDQIRLTSTEDDVLLKWQNACRDMNSDVCATKRCPFVNDCATLGDKLIERVTRKGGHKKYG